ncbi:MAG: YfiR family protein [Rickettsiales bacterium]|nr:YfiR family protein [Rickettsiales bacterium]
MLIVNKDALANEYNENQVKLAFILKVLDFIDNMPIDSNNLKLCLYGFNATEVDFIIEDLDYSKHTNLTLINEPALKNAKNCSIIFFQKNFEDYKIVLDYTKDYPILTFAEIKYFTDNSGLVEFYKYKGKYKFVINNDLAIKKEIFFNAKLLEISK